MRRPAVDIEMLMVMQMVNEITEAMDLLAMDVLGENENLALTAIDMTLRKKYPHMAECETIREGSEMVILVADRDGRTLDIRLRRRTLAGVAMRLFRL